MSGRMHAVMLELIIIPKWSFDRWFFDVVFFLLVKVLVMDTMMVTGDIVVDYGRLRSIGYRQLN